MKILLIIIALTSVSEVLYSQLNDSLALLTEEIKIEDYVWDLDTPYRLKSLAYNIQLENDSLTVIRNSSDTEINRNDERSTKTSFHKYKADIKDIGKIEFLNNLITPKYGNPFYDSKIEITSTRVSKIFDSIYDDGTKRKTWNIPIHVYKHSDSIKFRQIALLLSNHILPNENSMEANCAVDENHEWSGKKIDAIDNINLENKIHLNGEICDELAIKKLTSNYLKEQNIKGILGYIVINELNEFETLWTEQNNFYNLVNSANEMQLGFSYLIENIGVMSDNQLEGLFNILKSQEWQTGQCNNKPRKSYFDLAIKNEYFKEPRDNK